MSANLNRLTYFAAVLEEGTITAAAQRLGVSKAVVSKQIQSLEAEVGQSLLLRNTRNMSPTEAGQTLYARCRTALIEVQSAYDSVVEQDHRPRGKLRITAPVDFGLDLVGPLATQFRELHPQVQIELLLSDERRDLVSERLDLSFQVGWLRDSRNVARKLRDFREIIVASPLTSARFGPNAPEDLSKIPLAITSTVADGTPWVFRKGAEERPVTLAPAITMNVTLGVIRTVQEGAYFTILPDVLVDKQLASGDLVQLLPDWSLRKGGIYTVTPAGQIRSNALKAFLAMTRQSFRAN